MPGDLFWYPTGKFTGHVGIVGGRDATEIMAYEGNCANGYRCTRRTRGGLIFARTVHDISGACPGVVPSVLGAPGGTR